MIDENTSTRISTARKSGKTIGLVQGSWDMFHLGHLCYLQEARKNCDFLVVAMDDDEKIRYRKGANRPIIPLEERYQTIDRLGIADVIIVKKLGEEHWGLIKLLHPDVLIAIKENYTDDEIKELNKICGEVKILPRQATTSTSDIIRRTLIKNGVKSIRKMDPRVADTVESLKARVTHGAKLPEPWSELFRQVKLATDWITPVAAAYKSGDTWYYGINQIDQSLDQNELDNRTELFYDTIEHAEINLLKQLRGISTLDGPIYVILFPCDHCMKVLADKGIKTIYYLEDHPENGWSKRAHKKAHEKGIKTIQILIDKDGNLTERPDDEDISPEESDELYGHYKYIDPRNAREQPQLDTMIEYEEKGEDPLSYDSATKNGQDIIHKGKYWYAVKNRYPYKGAEYHFAIFALGEVYDIADVSGPMWTELKKIWDKLREDYQLAGGALCFRFGDTLRSGASLKRVHAHIIVSEPGEKAKFGIGSDHFGLKPGLTL